MGIYDRDYVQDRGGGAMTMGGGFRGLSPVVKWLLITNFIIFLLSISRNLRGIIWSLGAVWPETYWHMLQIWRVITYQFLHENAFHFLFNMIILFFFGPILEHLWGSRSFLKFYLLCGAAGGVVYQLLVVLNILPLGTMVGASGALYGILAASAILFPHMIVLIYGLIPMRIVWLVVLLIILSLLGFASGANAGGEAAHLSGLAAGALYVIYKPRFAKTRMEKSKGSWQKKIDQEQLFAREVDRILDKVHHEGITSLSSKEKEILQEATRREQMIEQEKR